MSMLGHLHYSCLKGDSLLPLTLPGKMIHESLNVLLVELSKTTTPLFTALQQ